MENKKINVILTILIIIFTISIITKLVEVQTFSSIKLGQDILEFGINVEDKYCYIQELKYTNPNWLFDMIIGGIYNLFKFYGVYIFTVIISVIIAVSLFYISKKRGSSIIVSFFMTIITIYFLNRNTGVPRALVANSQILPYSIFILEILFIENFLENGKKRYLIYLFINSVILVNVNATMWPLYFVLYIPYFIENMVFKIFERKNLKTDLYKIKILKSNKKSIILTIFFLLIILTGFVNPNGPIAFTYWYKILKGPVLQSISGLEPLVILDNMAVIIIFLIVVSIFTFTKIKLKISDCFMIFLLALLTIYSVENIVLLQLISCIIISRNVTEFINLYPDSKNEIEKLFFNKNTILALVLILICFVGYNFYERKDEDFLYEQIPTNLVSRIKNYNDIRLYNESSIGSYLMFNDIRVFIDTRYEMYCKEFNNTEIFENYCKIMIGKESYKNVFEKYAINYVLLNKSSIINTYIQKDDNYINVCEEGIYILYKKIN